jgi:hypothetical protein
MRLFVLKMEEKNQTREPRITNPALNFSMDFAETANPGSFVPYR